MKFAKYAQLAVGIVMIIIPVVNIKTLLIAIILNEKNVYNGTHISIKIKQESTI